MTLLLSKDRDDYIRVRFDAKRSLWPDFSGFARLVWWDLLSFGSMKKTSNDETKIPAV